MQKIFYFRKPVDKRFYNAGIHLHQLSVFGRIRDGWRVDSGADRQFVHSNNASLQRGGKIQLLRRTGRHQPKRFSGITCSAF